MRGLVAGTVGRLVVATLVAAVVTGLVGVWLVQAMERQNLRQQAIEENLLRAERTAVRIDDRLGAVAAQLELLASDTQVMERTDTATAELEVALGASRLLDQLVLYDVDGQPVAAAATSGLIDGSTLPAATAAEPDHSGRIPSRIVSGAGELPAVEVRVGVDNPPGTPAGILAGRAPLVLVNQDVTGQQPAGQAGIFLTDGEGRIVSHRELERVVEGEVFDLDVFAESRHATIEHDGDTALVVAARPETLEGWVIVEQSQRDVLGPAEAMLGGMTRVLLAVVAAIAVVVVVAGRRLLRPLGPLAEAVTRLEAGDLDARVEERGVGELGVLAEGFNRMAAALQARQRELTEAEQAARASEERLRLMVEGVTDYAIVLLDPVGRVQSWNAGAERLTAFAAEEVIGRPLSDLHDPDDPPPDPLPDAVRGGRGDTQGWWRRADGNRFWGHLVVTRLGREAAAPYGYAAIVHDLTQQQAARQAMTEALRREKEAADELRQADRVKDEFLAIAAHEIRTPLSAILGAAEMLTGYGRDIDPAERTRLHEMIATYAQDMRAIVERLLDFTRLQAGRVRLHPESFDLRAELGAVLELAERELVDHPVVFDAPQTIVRLDRHLLRHVATNLVSNAAKFSPAGSSITVAAAVADSRLRLSVADEGAGIAPVEQELIFDLFRQGSTAGAPGAGGTGVGLAIVKRYVELAGGDVRVDSERGRGSTFTITVPLTGTVSTSEQATDDRS